MRPLVSEGDDPSSLTCVSLAGGGLTGLMDPVSPGYACGSDTAHMSILGYDPFMYVAS